MALWKTSSTSSNTAPLSEAIFLRHLAQQVKESPNLLVTFADIEGIMALPESKLLARAIKEARTEDPVILAQHMKIPAAELSAMYDWIDSLPHGVVDIHAQYAFLYSLSSRRSALADIEKAKQTIAAGMQPPFSVLQELAQSVKVDVSGLPTISSDTWQDYFKRRQEERRLAMDRGYKFVTFPPSFKDLNSALAPGLRHGIMSVLMESGTGKTSFVSSLANWWAECGHNVVFVTTEDSSDEIMDRLLTVKANVKMSDLFKGKASPDLIEALTPFPSGGRIVLLHDRGYPPATIVELARRNHAHLILDLVSDLSIEGVVDNERDMATKVQKMMSFLDQQYAAEYQRMVVVTLQLTVDARRRIAEYPRAITEDDAAGGANLLNKSSYFIVGQSPKPAKEIEMQHPLEAGRVILRRRTPSLLMAFQLAKARKADSQEAAGRIQMAWRHPRRYTIEGISDPDGTYRQALNDMYKAN